MKDKTKPFPYGDDGPPNKQTEKQKRGRVSDDVRGYLPSISMASTAQLRHGGVSPLSIIVLQLLVREQKIEASRKRGTDNLRVPVSVRRTLQIRNKDYQNCLKRLEEVGAITINRDKAWTACIKIDTETQVRDTLVDKYGQRRERRW